MNKFNAVTTIKDGKRFDSKKEANRFRELQLLERGGVISGLKRQVRYLLIPSQYDETGEFGEQGACIEKSVNYYADFVYFKNGKLIVEDCKGYKKGAAYELFVIKRKLMLSVYGIKVLET